ARVQARGWGGVAVHQQVDLTAGRGHAVEAGKGKRLVAGRAEDPRADAGELERGVGKAGHVQRNGAGGIIQRPRRARVDEDGRSGAGRDHGRVQRRVEVVDDDVVEGHLFQVGVEINFFLEARQARLREDERVEADRAVDLGRVHGRVRAGVGDGNG